ncbi:MAG: hypothetical protein CVV47_07595 [Spirochaetae bacterium HGW-Spirochaetae-3]|nr:MAG: hypothetical protein CVV47_07595 [Spirochaetae bacterium HGW-Spirochaetae-3]
MEPREAYATGFTFRALDGAGRIARIPRGSGGLYLYTAPGAASPSIAALLTASGSAFPVLSGLYDDGGGEATAALEGLRGSKTARAYRPSACIGASDHVAALERAMRWRPVLDVEYDAMSVGPEIHPASAGGVAEYRRADPGDLDALYPLAAAYEKAEVITAIHAFDPEACRAAQAKSLRAQVVYLATVRGRVVARAQTNARGWSYDQIGGVFVDPAFRGLGIGGGVVAALVADIAGRGRGASLFVKKANAVARSLYLSLGFAVSRDYRVSYFT